MKRRARVARANGGGAPTDLLLCFPSGARLALMPKPICSPSKSADLAKRHPTLPTNRGHSIPLFLSKTGNNSGGGGRAAVDDVTDEPTSPKVTCAGQIKIRPRSSSGRNPTTSSARDSKGWLSVMGEMEKLHSHSKKPLMHFLAALRSSVRFDLRCFGSFHGSVDCSTDEEEGAEEEEEEEEGVEEDKDLEDSASRSIISKWFMVLEQNQRHGLKEEDMEKEADADNIDDEEVVPPPNALFLMRSRSAPAKGGRGIIITHEEEEEVIEAEETKEERLLLMSYAPDFMKLSTEIAKETWVVGKFNPLARSRSWKR